MKVGVVLAEGPFLQNFLETQMDWTCEFLPRKGEMLAQEVLKERMDWGQITKKEIMDRLKPEYKDWGILYDSVRTLYHCDSEDSERIAHKKGMQRMMDEYMGAMCFVGDVIWRDSEEGCYPVIWLTNKDESTRGKELLDEYYAKAQKKDRKAFEKMVEEEGREYTFDWLTVFVLLAVVGALWLIYKIVFVWWF